MSVVCGRTRNNCVRESADLPLATREGMLAVLTCSRPMGRLLEGQKGLGPRMIRMANVTLWNSAKVRSRKRHDNEIWERGCKQGCCMQGTSSSEGGERKGLNIHARLRITNNELFSVIQPIVVHVDGWVLLFVTQHCCF